MTHKNQKKIFTAASCTQLLRYDNISELNCLKSNLTFCYIVINLSINVQTLRNALLY